MANNATSRAPSSTAPQTRSNPFKVSVFFSSDGIRVVLKQPAPADTYARARKVYNSAQRQCCNHMLSEPPKNFDVEVYGGMVAPIIDVKIQPCLVQHLPVLAEIAASTSPAGDECSEREEQEADPAEIELPCSIWGLVSLLIFTEGGVSLKRWFQSSAPDCDPSLPVQTLEAATFMGCQTTQKQITEWLKKILKDVVQHSQQADSDNLLGTPIRMQQACARIWHSTQVLKILQGESAKEVFSSLSCDAGSFADAASAASHLPQDLFAQWVASCAPVLDFQAVQLSPMQWMRLSACCAHIDRAAVTTLHLNAATVPSSPQSRPLSEFEHTLLAWRQAPSKDAVCSGCGHHHHGSATKFCAGFTCEYAIRPHQVCGRSLATVYALMYDITTVLTSGTADGGKRVVQEVQQFAATAPSTPSLCERHHEFSKKPNLLCPGFSCPDCGRFCVTDHNKPCALATIKTDVPPPTHSINGATTLSAVHREFDGVGSLGSDSMHALYMMGGAASSMLQLQHLGVHRLPLTFQAVSALGQVLSSLSSNLSKLTITTENVQGSVLFSVHEKVLFFRAVGLVSSLRELHMPQWEAVVGDEAGDCVEPLYRLPDLEAVYVAEVKESPAFPSGIAFRAIPADS